MGRNCPNFSTIRGLDKLIRGDSETFVCLHQTISSEETKIVSSGAAYLQQQNVYRRIQIKEKFAKAMYMCVGALIAFAAYLLGNLNDSIKKWLRDAQFRFVHRTSPLPCDELKDVLLVLETSR